MKKNPSKKVTKKITKKTTKKVVRPPTAYEFANPIAREKVRAFVNDSFRMAQSCLENGSEYSHKCIELQYSSRGVAEALGFKQDHWYGEFK